MTQHDHAFSLLYFLKASEQDVPGKYRMMLYTLKPERAGPKRKPKRCRHAVS